jgi:hypothetical protein
MRFVSGQDLPDVVEVVMPDSYAAAGLARAGAGR